MANAAMHEEVGRRREFFRWLLVSAFVHGIAVSGVIAVPFLPSRRPLPPVVSVDLVAALPNARPAKPAPAPRAQPKPVVKKVLLPVRPRNEPAPPKPAPPKPKPVEYEDVLARLRAEQGESRPEPAPTASEPAPGPVGGPEVAAWVRAARIHVGRAWLLAPGLRAQGLVAHVQVRLDAEGHVLGEPHLTRRSGNPWFDDSLLHAIQKASPLPPPPAPGEWTFVFDPEVYF